MDGGTPAGEPTIELVDTLGRRRGATVAASALLAATVVGIWALAHSGNESTGLRPATESAADTALATQLVSAEDTVAPAPDATMPDTTMQEITPASSVVTSTPYNSGWGCSGPGCDPHKSPSCANTPAEPLMPNIVGVTVRQATSTLSAFFLSYDLCHDTPIHSVFFKVPNDATCYAGIAPDAVILEQGIAVGSWVEGGYALLNLTLDRLCNGGPKPTGTPEPTPTPTPWPTPSWWPTPTPTPSPTPSPTPVP